MVVDLTIALTVSSSVSKFSSAYRLGGITSIGQHQIVSLPAA